MVFSLSNVNGIGKQDQDDCLGLLIEKFESQSAPRTRPESLERMPDAHWRMPRPSALV
jgi:hypothetical protein